MITRMTMAMVFGALLAGGCGGPDEDGADDVGPAIVAGDDDGSVEQDLTGGYLFHCRKPQTSTELAQIRITKTKAEFKAVDPELIAANAVYKRVANYQPRSAAHQGQSEYVWTPPSNHRIVLLVDEPMRTGGIALRIGGHGGFVDLEGPQFPHSHVRFICAR